MRRLSHIHTYAHPTLRIDGPCTSPNKVFSAMRYYPPVFRHSAREGREGRCRCVTPTKPNTLQHKHTFSLLTFPMFFYLFSFHFSASRPRIDETPTQTHHRNPNSERQTTSNAKATSNPSLRSSMIRARISNPFVSPFSHGPELFSQLGA